MPDKETIERAHEDAAQGKSASTQAGEFVREEIHHVREGKHGARSPKQAIAGRQSCIAARAPLLGFAPGACRSGTRRRHAPRPAGAQRCGKEGGPDEGPDQAPRGGPQGSADAQGTVARRNRCLDDSAQRLRVARLRTLRY